MNKLIVVLLVVAAAAVGIILLASRQGGQPTPYLPNIPGVTQGTPTSEIQSAQDLQSAQNNLDNTGVDTSMNSDLNGLNSDSSNF